MERLVLINPDASGSICQVVRGLREMGVINRGDEVMVGADLSLDSGRRSFQVRVEDVFRDGGDGPIETVPQTYWVSVGR